MTAIARTFCRSCIAACGLVVELDGDAVLRIRGDRAHPVSAGYSCEKGRGLGALEHHAGRLLVPRVDGRATAPTAAVEDLGRRLAGVVGAGGPGAVATYQGTGAGFDAALADAARRFADGHGFRRHTSLTVDAVAKPHVADLVAGDARLVAHPDPAAALLLVVGTNPVVSHGHTVAVTDPVRVLRARAAAGRTWVLDPRRTESARLATDHLAVRPGTDHLVVGLLVRDALERADRAALHRLATGAGALGATVGRLTPDGVAESAGVAVDDLDRLRAEVTAAGRVAWLSGTGATMAAAANLTEWLLWCLGAATDSLERPGGMWFHPGSLAPLGPARVRRTGAAAPGRPRFGQHPCTALVPAIEAGEVRALVVVGGSPLTAFPQPDRVRGALASLEVLAVLDVLDGELAAMATHVLPCPTQLERPDVTLPVELAQPARVAQRTPALRGRPPGVRSGCWWLAATTAAVAGEAAPTDDPDAALDALLARSPVAADVLAAGAPVLLDDGTPPAPWALGRPGERPLDLAPPPLLRAWHEALDLAARPTGASGPGGEPMLSARLLARRPTNHVNATRPALPDAPALRLSPSDAEALALVGGRRVDVGPVLDGDRSVRVVARIDPTLPAGCVTVDHAHPDLPAGAFVSAGAVDPDTGMPTLTGVAVTLRPAPEEHH